VKIFTLLALIVSGAALTVAQERVIDKAEFDAAVNGTDGHKIKWAGQSYRIDVSSSSKVLNRPDSDYSATIIIEFGPSRSVRSLTTSTYGGKTNSKETVVLGELSYTRENNSLWTVEAKSANPSSVNGSAANTDSAPPESVVSSDISYFLVGKDRIQGATAAVFRKVEKRREVDVPTRAESESVITEVYWIVDGMQRRHELLSQHRSGKLNSNNTVNMEWNLDPAIAIIAPITDVK
jgi:hypothetical protein